MDLLKRLEQEFSLKEFQVKNTVELLDAGNTVPFIARYRKEATGSLDDQLLRELSDRLTYLRGLQKRKEEVLRSIEEQEKLTPELQRAFENAATLAEVEDLYRPYRPRRRTRGSIAREKGLEPLAAAILKQERNADPLALAAGYVSEEKQVLTPEEALAGARDILAEDFSDDAALRKGLRAYLFRTGQIVSKAPEPKADSVYAQYDDFSQPVNRIAGHRVLALNRGEREEYLKVTLQADVSGALGIMEKAFCKGDSSSASQTLCTRQVQEACDDSYKRLIFPSLETEIRSTLTERASEDAIKVFSLNLRQLLMQPPVKGSVTLGLDPAYRTGCKIAVVDDTGKVLDTAVVYPTPPQKKVAEAKKTLTALILRHHVTTIAIGNGTASRESESFVADLLKELPHPVSYMVVSEAGASVYSASKLAAEEFPEYDVSLRSAVSIARRLQDPLAELVKIDPKAIGVGQYQHDMPQKRLGEALDGVVEACVNGVGVDVNTASFSLLSHVAGIGPGVAKNIVAYREENGAFPDRKRLLKVPKLGPKAFEQCAGFLRVPGADNPLDATAVHPESYEAAEKLLTLCGYTLADVADGNIGELPKKAEQLGIPQLAQQAGVGEPTLRDMIGELVRPGRDPREELPPPLLRSDVLEIKDLKKGMELKGTVRNVIDFGAFVDIGVHQDGLVHISQIADRYIKHPLDAVQVGDVVTVWVLDVDQKRGRISLTMKQPKEQAGQ